MPNLTGQILASRYRVDEFLGRGGMSEVYKVWDSERATYLALKLLREDLAQDVVFLRRFQREAKNLAKLQHPNIVRFYGLGQDDLLSFILMDFVEGSSLRTEIFRCRGQGMPTEDIQNVMRGVCSALHFAHRSGVVHCDMKPGNVLIDERGRPLVTDFGIARMSDAATATMVGMGTPAYMAPEQILCRDPTPETDIYAVGVTLYEMITGGERPFTGENASITATTSEKVRWEQIYLSPPSPRRWNPDISDDLEAVVMRCLAKDPVERYASPLDLLNALELVLPAGSAGAADESLDDAETFVSISSPVGGSPEFPEWQEESDVVFSQHPDEQKPYKREFLPFVIGLAIFFVVVGAGLFVMGRGGDGPLAMQAAATETPSVAASPLPTETLEDTPSPLPSETASITPSQTWTVTHTPSQTPTDIANSPPTDTPTSAQTLTPSLLPEGYSIVPDVIGLDFYTAGLRLQEDGFGFEKIPEFNSEVPNNSVFKLNPEAGLMVQEGIKIKMYIATETQVMYTMHIDHHIHWDDDGAYYYVNLPAETWCQANFVNVNHKGEEFTNPGSVIRIYPPRGKSDQLIASLWSSESRQFKTKESGEYQIFLRYAIGIDADFVISCKP